MRRSGKLTPLKESQDDLLATMDFNQYSTSLIAMRRSLQEPMEQFPKVQVQNTSLPTGGITQSVETSVAEGKAELEVLKAILNREGYINRLTRSSRSVNKKFKPEVADILDLVRAASLDVIEAIVRWREAKQDHDAAFMWNQVNYLLKMPSDLDFLSKYLAIERHVGFGLTRNPFVVPSPLEDGVILYKDLILNPGGISGGGPQDGFMIVGGMTAAMLKSKYEPSKQTLQNAGKTERFDPTVIISPYGRPAKKTQKELEAEKEQQFAKSNSFVTNSDMKRLRQAELVILKEEDKFGRWSRDPDDRLVPHLQAQARLAAVELKKDDRRAIHKPSFTAKSHAPHAASSDVGLVEEVWQPQANPKNELAQSKYLENVDEDVNALRRGEGKIGGQLAPLSTKGVETRIRKPIRSSVGSQMEFNRYRRKKMLTERLAEIDQLRREIQSQKETLDEVRKKTLQKKREAARQDHTTKTDSSSVRTKSAGGSDLNRPKSVGFEVTGGINTQPLPSISASTDEDITSSSSGKDRLTSGNGVIGTNVKARTSQAVRDASTIEIDPRGEGETMAVIRATVAKHDEGLERLREEERQIMDQIEHIDADDLRMLDVKEQERRMTGAERSREIERKRRLLTSKEGKRKGPPPPESSNSYDWFAIKCQATIRGWLARCFAKWYRQACRKACIIIQATIRGKLGRLRVSRYKVNYFAQQQIAKIFRGYKARGVAASASAGKNLGKAAVLIQKIYRGHVGKKRAKSKRSLDIASAVARESVDPRALLASDVRELGLRIQYAVEEPETSVFPPDEVLYLIRLATVILQQSRGVMGMSEYNFINARYYGEVEGETMTWAQASRMLNRAERIMRLIRTLAYGPAEKPPRIIQIAPVAQLLYGAQLANPKWKLETFENMGMGSKFATQLFLWVQSINEVAQRQVEFGSFLASSFPDWLPKLYEIQANKRKAELVKESGNRCIGNLKEQQIRNSEDKLMVKLLQENINTVNQEITECDVKIEELIHQESELCSAQQDRESYAVIAMEQRLRDMNKKSEELTHEYTTAERQANNGIAKAREDIVVLRAELTKHQLSVKTLDGQFRLLCSQVQQNSYVRLEEKRVPLSSRVKAAAAGEARAAEMFEIAKMACFLDAQGVRHADDLPWEARNQYTSLDTFRQDVHSQAWKLLQEAENERKAFDKTLNDGLIEQQKKEIASKDRVAPSDEEMEEERREDDHQAKIERLKKLQFIPDTAMYHDHPARPRPVIIALGRDIPEHCKNKMVAEITKLMPGLFVFLDCPTNMGLNVDEMQKVLDAKKCIIMMVDHGLTRTTRVNFLKSFAVTIKALIPNPFVAMCVGHEKNVRISSNSHFGTAKQDIQRLHDCDIKVALEGMAWVVREIQQPSIQKILAQRSTLIEAPSQSFVNVCEALFCLIHGVEGGAIRAPEVTLTAMSWRFTAQTLADPLKLARKLKDVPRGKSDLRTVQSLAEYINGINWPAPMSPMRQSDPIMHMLALFVELFVTAEKRTIERGGMPAQPLSKGATPGVQCVEVVADSEDREDMLAQDNSQGWRMTAAKLVRVALQDLRTMKTVMKINGHLLNVSAYREEEIIYFDTYDSQTSEVHICSVPRGEIPYLLMPSAEVVEKKGRPKPPQDKKELYQQLADLLKFEPILKTAAHSRKIITCKREYTLLRSFKTKLNGHSAFIKCFEAALGQLYFTAWLSESGADISILLEERSRLDLLTNADPILEAPHVHHDDARHLLGLATDRLKISPSATMMRVARNGEPFNKLAYRKKQGLLSDIKAQGFALKVRTRRGPGRILCRRVLVISGVTHLLDVRVATFERMLILGLYEPQKRHKMEFRMPQYLRKAILGTDSDDYVRWIDILLKKIRINWRGEHSIYVDTIISRSVRKIAGKRLLVKVQVESEDSVKVVLIDSAMSSTFEAIVNREQFIRILLYEQVGDTIKRDFGVTVQKDAIRNILNEMARGPTLQPGEVSKGNDEVSKKGAVVDPKLFTIPLIDILSHQDQVAYFTKQLELCISRIRADSEAYGYYTKNPVHIEFLPPARPNNLAKMDANLRFEPRLKQGPRDGDLAGVLRCRRQAIYRNMEDDLNELALQLARAAAAKAAADRQAAEDFERKLLGLKSEHEKEEEEKAARAAQEAEEAWLIKHREERLLKAGLDSGLAGEASNTESAQMASSRPASAAVSEKGSISVSKPVFDLDAVIEEASYLTADNLVQTIEEQHQVRRIERAQPGTTQEVRRINIMSGNGKDMVTIDANLLTVEQRAILGRGERKVFEGGCKTTFRDTRASWSGHVAVTVYETLCWMGDDGLGRRLKFEVYEPGSASLYLGSINNLNHCMRILGTHGRDLLEPAKITEMILFIVKFRMRVVDNTITWDGHPNEPDAPRYRIEFETVRLFTEEKVTPINANSEADEEANKDKLFEAEKKRGKKIIRLVRRINGQLMQLSVFEVATTAEQMLAIQSSKIASASINATEASDETLESQDASADLQKGHAEKRPLTKTQRHVPPSLKIIGYDPRSKRKATYIAPPAAILEVAGGIYSPYLEHSRRRELAKIACEALSLNFPKGKPFELVMAWSGSAKEFASAAVAVASTKGITRSSAEAVLKRPGKLFRTAMVIGKLECVVTLYQSDVPGQDKNTASGYVAKQLVVNVYSRAASEATEIVITDQEQIERIGRTISSFPEGELRAAGVRRLMRFLHCALIDDLENKDVNKKLIHVVLRPPNKDFLTEYMQTKPSPPGEDIRPTGCPSVFLPLNTCGPFVYRCSMQLANKALKGALTDYIVTIYTKSDNEGPERGLVIKIYERDTSVTCVMHLGPSELMRIMEAAGEPDLLRDLVTALNEAKAHKLDEVETRFVAVTEKGEIDNKALQLSNAMSKIVLDDVAVTISPDQHLVPYLKSRGPQGIMQ